MIEKITPEPWIVENGRPKDVCLDGYLVRASNGDVLCAVTDHDITERLILAAPRMYYMLKALATFDSPEVDRAAGPHFAPLMAAAKQLAGCID